MTTPAANRVLAVWRGLLKLTNKISCFIGCPLTTHSGRDLHRRAKDVPGDMIGELITLRALIDPSLYEVLGGQGPTTGLRGSPVA